jgi:hypothetical protein
MSVLSVIASGWRRPERRLEAFNYKKLPQLHCMYAILVNRRRRFDGRFVLSGLVGIGASLLAARLLLKLPGARSIL